MDGITDGHESKLRETVKDRGKHPDAGKDGRQKKGVTEDETVEWHYQFNGHKFEQTLGDSEDKGAWHVAVHEVAKSRI